MTSVHNCEEKEITYDHDRTIKHRLIYVRDMNIPIRNPTAERVFVCCRTCVDIFIEFHLPKLLTICDMHDNGILPSTIEFKSKNMCPFKQKELNGSENDKRVHSINFDEFRSAGEIRGKSIEKGASVCCYGWADDYLKLLDRTGYKHDREIGREFREMDSNGNSQLDKVQQIQL